MKETGMFPPNRTLRVRISESYCFLLEASLSSMTVEASLTCGRLIVCVGMQMCMSVLGAQNTWILGDK